MGWGCVISAGSLSGVSFRIEHSVVEFFHDVVVFAVQCAGGPVEPVHEVVFYEVSVFEESESVGGTSPREFESFCPVYGVVVV